ncbi:MAG: Clp protease ClpP [Oscillospiraceae bacterium]|jgi:ATP-dependent protease ClpP protease subunit|nr:Clp protease ClpP [Oscillospiraceae bacterium]
MIWNLVREGTEAHIYIYGDIVSMPWEEMGEFGSITLAKELEKLGELRTIIVHINSNGGEVKEALAIYNVLKNQKRTVKTICDGFACSSAVLVFLAGSERVVNEGSMLFIHNVNVYTAGTAEELRKDAADLDKINDVMKGIYIDAGVKLTFEELQAKFDAETWLDCTEALTLGFATVIKANAVAENRAGKIVRDALMGAKPGQLNQLNITAPGSGVPENTNKLKQLFGGKKQ